MTAAPSVTSVTAYKSLDANDAAAAACKTFKIELVIYKSNRPLTVSEVRVNDFFCDGPTNSGKRLKAAIVRNSFFTPHLAGDFIGQDVT